MHARLCFVCIVSLVYDIHVIYTSDIHHTILNIVLGQLHFIVNDQQNSELHCTGLFRVNAYINLQIVAY